MSLTITTTQTIRPPLRSTLHHPLNRRSAPSPYDLDQIHLPSYPPSPKPSSAPSHPSHHENDIESPSPPSNAHPIVPSFTSPRKNIPRVLTTCLCYFTNGMSDAAPGALLPYLESDYGINYALVSLIFVSNAVGFLIAAVFAEGVERRLGRGKGLVGAEGLMGLGYAVVSSGCGGVFAGVEVGFLVMGCGNGVNLAFNNVFCANLANSTVILGAAHGSYGLGGIVSPILVTVMTANGIPWNRFYLILLGIRLVSMVLNGWAYWDFEKDGSSRMMSRSTDQEDEATLSKRSLLWRALKMKVTILGALFIFAYQGAEVSESGWFISYLIQERQGDPHKVGYVTSGFWGGITVGRFVLTHFAHRVGEKWFVAGMGVAVIGLQVMAWLIPDIVGDAVAVAILGLLLGPIYPCAQTVFSRLLPRSVQVTAVGFIGSAGSSGGALVPFLTGIVAQAVNQTFVLHPICIGSFVLMLVCWIGLPKVEKRRD